MQRSYNQPMAAALIRSRLLWVAGLIMASACANLACVASHSDRDQVSGPPGNLAAQATAASAPETAPTDAVLTVTVRDLRNHKGDLIFGVFDQPAGFPNVRSKSRYWEVKPADADAVTFTVRLPPGRYAAGVLHDENRSGDMDKGLAGIPLEGYGVTNNPKPQLRKATFDEAAFTMPPQGTQLTISVQYF